MKSITHKANGQEFLIVEVPEGLDVDDIQLIDSNELGIGYKNPDPDVDNWITKYIELPPGQYSIMFVAEYATEEQAAMVVDSDLLGYWASPPNKDYCFYLDAIDALDTIIRANFTDTSKKRLVLKVV